MLLRTTREKPSACGERLHVDGVAGAGDRAGAERQRIRFRAHGGRADRDRAAARRRD